MRTRVAKSTPGKNVRLKLRSYSDIIKNKNGTLGVAKQAIETLTTKHGIDAIDLSKHIDIFGAFQHFGTGRRRSEWFTCDGREARSLAHRLLRVSEDLRASIAPQFKQVLRDGPLSLDKACSYLEAWAALIQNSMDARDDRQADWTLEPKRDLTQFVWRKAGKPHPLDAQLAELIGAILDRPYTYEDQRKFRQRSCHFEGTDSHAFPVK